MRLVRTGKMMPFLDVQMGAVYFAHDRYWTRCDYDAGIVLTGAGDRMGSACNFLIHGTVPSEWTQPGIMCEPVEVVRLEP